MFYSFDSDRFDLWITYINRSRATTRRGGRRGSLRVRLADSGTLGLHNVAYRDPGGPILVRMSVINRVGLIALLSLGLIAIVTSAGATTTTTKSPGNKDGSTTAKASISITTKASGSSTTEASHHDSTSTTTTVAPTVDGKDLGAYLDKTIDNVLSGPLKDEDSDEAEGASRMDPVLRRGLRFGRSV